MVTKMNETTTTTVIETVNSPQQQQPQQNATVVTITLHPQPDDLENCDNISATAITPSSCDSDTIERSQAIIKKSLKLDLTHSNNDDTIEDDENVKKDVIDSPTEKEAGKSPTSPKSPKNARGVTHQTSLTSSVDVVDDRKALRDALYQGIFHRHRRTIFAVGSFLRMLKSRSSQYNTIRSSSEGEDDSAR